MQYAEKELLVFKAFKKILFSDSDVAKITVSEIAKEAGIGKGTVYEYFKSKEEIIARSLVYTLYEEINIVSGKIDENLTFKENCYILFDFLLTKFISISPYFKLLSSNFKINEFYKYLKSDTVLENNIKKDIDSIVSKVISIGISEHLVKENDDIDYQKFVIRSACSGIANSFCENHKNIPPTDLETCKAYAYEFLKRALQ